MNHEWSEIVFDHLDEARHCERNMLHALTTYPGRRVPYWTMACEQRLQAEMHWVAAIEALIEWVAE